MASKDTQPSTKKAEDIFPRNLLVDLAMSSYVNMKEISGHVGYVCIWT